MSEKKYDNIRKEKEIERMRQELLERYEEKWRPCKQVIPPANDIPEYLGELDADLEWSNDTEGAYKKFLNIEAYKKFIENGNLILMGRTGTGKSSILHRYAYAINSGEISDFSMAICINLEELFKVLIHYTFIENIRNDTYIKDAIEIVIKLHVIKELVNRFSNVDRCKYEYNPRMLQLTKYLRLHGITRYTNIVRKLSDQIDEYNEPNSNIRDVVLELKKAYKDLEEEGIQNILHSILVDQKMLILIDSLDHYDITEKKVIYINKALVEVVFDYFKDFSSQNILLKAAIPSEIYTHIIEQIAAKKKTKTVAIEWRFKDIVKMIALKVYYYFDINNRTLAEDVLVKYAIEDLFDYDTAYSFLHEILPLTCRACIPVDFETIPYCIRHTQKKPRQIVTIFNALIDKICLENQFDYFKKNSEEICNYVHMAQKSIINDALNMYNVVAKEKILPIVKSVLDKKKIILDASELNNAIKDAQGIIGSVGLSDSEVKQILIESGMIGQLLEDHYVQENSYHFNNRQVLKISIALFEYQIKDTLPQVKSGKYVLHPMCYEYYNNELDYNCLVYPSSADDIDDNIIAKLEGEGIIV